MYYPNDEKFTRLVEYKKFTKYKSKSSLIGMEIPSTNGMHSQYHSKKKSKSLINILNHYPNGTLLLGELEHIDMKLI